MFTVRLNISLLFSFKYFFHLIVNGVLSPLSEKRIQVVNLILRDMFFLLHNSDSHSSHLMRHRFSLLLLSGVIIIYEFMCVSVFLFAIIN